MSHFSDFMDGVPVKISDKYKRPPRIDLPYSVYECPARSSVVVDTISYCSTFENNILSKLKELRSAKKTKKNERQHRLQLLQEAKQKKLDAIAIAEAEEKLKQLNVSEVSYPSAEEIIPLSPDEKINNVCGITIQNKGFEVVENAVNEETNCLPCNETDNQQNILQPIQIVSNYPKNLLDDPDPLKDLKMNIKFNKIPVLKNVETMTYKDFENDTSSPFDNVELKTINEMELLAQVLQNERTFANCPQPVYPNQMSGIPEAESEIGSGKISYDPNTYIPVHSQGLYSVPIYQNGYYVSAEYGCDNVLNENVNNYIPQYQYYTSTNPHSSDPYFITPSLATENHQPINAPIYIPQPYYFLPQQEIINYNPRTTSDQISDTHQDLNEVQVQSPSFSNTIKSRSRSVPDIVRELNEELASAKLRINERSHNASPAPKNLKNQDYQASTSKKKTESGSKKKRENLPDPYHTLSPKFQEICQKVHTMGFPLDRVARVCTLLGDNDKKIIEGLLIMGELMDLGFSEGKVSAALAKHEFNRDKALDELVS